MFRSAGKGLIPSRVTPNLDARLRPTRKPPHHLGLDHQGSRVTPSSRWRMRSTCAGYRVNRKVVMYWINSVWAKPRAKKKEYTVLHRSYWHQKKLSPSLINNLILHDENRWDLQYCTVALSSYKKNSHPVRFMACGMNPQDSSGFMVHHSSWQRDNLITFLYR